MSKDAAAKWLEEHKEPQINMAYAKSIGLDMDGLETRIAAKFIADGEIHGYTNLWGNPDRVDLERDYFTKDTDFWDGTLGKAPRPLTWDHAQDPDFKANPVIGQMVDFGDDDIGRWYVAKLDRSHKYNKAIEALIKAGKLGTSSDSAPQYVERVKQGKSYWLKTWPLFAAALTDSPCEPRMMGTLEHWKSLGIALPDTTVLTAWDWAIARMKRINLTTR